MRISGILGRAGKRRIAVLAVVTAAGATVGTLPVFAPAAAAATVPAEAGQYVPVNPTRVVNGATVPLVSSTAPNAALPVTVTGVAGMPPNVSAVQFQLSAKGTGTGTLVAYPTGAARPATTTIQYLPNVGMTNDVVVELGTGNQAYGAGQALSDTFGIYRGKVFNTAVGGAVLLPEPAGGAYGEHSIDISDDGMLVAWTHCLATSSSWRGRRGPAAGCAL